MKRSIYQDQLKNLESQLAKLPDSKLGFRIKVLTMLLVAMRFEPHLFNTSLDKHPYLILKEIILDAQKVASIFSEILFLEDLSNSNIYNESKDKEKKHRDLFNVIWNKFNKNDFDNYIKIYVKRIKINNLSDFIKEKRCIDLGSGNGVFCFALLECGAKSVVGLDFGEHNTKFASEIAKLRGISDRAEFVTRSVYETGFNDGEFDFIIQNGVFHHLNNPHIAIQEAARISKRDALFWYYCNSKDSMEADILDCAVAVLKKISSEELYNFYTELNIGTGKKAHLTDGFKATYERTSLTELNTQMKIYGFSFVSRALGGGEFDYDHDRVAKDSYGQEKYGEGNLRIIYNYCSRR